MALLLAAVTATPSNSRSNNGNVALKPSQWLNPREVEQLPALSEVTVQKLESMSVDEGSDLLQKLCKYKFYTY